MPDVETVPTVKEQLVIAHQKIDQLIDFIEQVEALSLDSQTQYRIRHFMRENGYWSKTKKTNF